jgi:membrane associated rhomboid family serine protease
LFPIGDENRSTVRPYVNYALLITNIVVFFFFYLGGAQVLWNAIVEYGTIPSYILKGERLWTLVTSMFMHADPVHLLGNMAYLWVFGDNIEGSIGHGKYLLFYLLGGLAASFAHIASTLVALPLSGVAGFDPLGIPSVGASGAISAILGAYLLLFPRARIRTLIIRFFITIVRVPAMYYLGFWFLYQLLLGVVSITGLSFASIAFWAHIGGFVFGVLTVKLFNVKPRVQPRATPRQILRMRRCPYCGYENAPTGFYCANCGSRIR